MKPFISTEIFTHADQSYLIQPTPEMDGIECYLRENGKDSEGAFYITKDELPSIIKKMQEMMDYVSND